MGKRKNRTSSIAISSSNSSAPKKNEVTFKAFFSRCVNLGKARYWEENQIYAFFKNRNLKDKEDLDTYQKMLGKY